jgi:DNA-directed RNA polymerase subunit RPC12/RpoP
MNVFNGESGPLRHLLETEAGLQQFLRLLRSEGIKWCVRKLAKDRFIRFEDGYRHHTYRCLRCGEFYVHIDFKLIYSSGSFQPVYDCSICGSSLQHEDLYFAQNPSPDRPSSLASYPCPRCKNKTLNIEDLLLLD